MLTRINIKIPTGRDIYIHASLIGFDCSPIRNRGIFIDEELKIHPTLMCCNPNFNPTISINKERISNNKVRTLPAILGIELMIMSIETKPPHLYAEGAINPVIQSIKNLAASSGHGKALFKTYLKNT